MMMIKILLALLIVVSYNAKVVLAAGDGEFMDLTTNARFDGFVILGINSAYEDFEKFGYEIANFTVIINASENLTVTFVPKFHPDEGHTLGGQTKFGRQVSYIIDKSTGDIVTKNFAR
ncbi:hypothetical protein SAMN06297280_0505 [Arsukibacterium tuosuense]|uniref:Uncharacterized protein n=1 Tax=Arsukibacterium tuosuense TaxID=1323745 RepID=A0A285I4N4_9GAMM|nr:hypothetical protein [Arsukibacterium tuosuense]SNY42928.1 hypothetical protein SAMN06297280_0505 [Arsukibacterium tuosuense]